MKRSKRKRSFSVSFPGVVYALLGVLLLLNGFIRGELFSSLCGTILVIFTLYGLISVWLSFLSWKGTPLSVEWSKSDVLSIRVTVVSRKDRKTRFSFSRVTCQLVFIVEGNASARFSVSARVDGPETITILPLPTRGIYRAMAPVTVVSDFAGFFSVGIPHPDKEAPMPLVVDPVPERAKSPEWRNSRFGSFTGKSMYRRSDELYESRPYMPGDDPRKINWKVYAHIGDLSIRQGDLLPPPASEYTFLINTLTANQPDNATRSLFEILINRTTNIALELLSQNRIVTVGETTAGKWRLIDTIRPDDTDAEKKLLSAFAVPQICHDGEPLQMNRLSLDSSNTTILFVSLSEKAWLNTSMDKENVSVLLGPWFEPMAKTPARERLRSLFFESSERDLPVNAALYQARLENAYDALRKEGIDATKI